MFSIAEVHILGHFILLDSGAFWILDLLDLSNVQQCGCPCSRIL